MSLQTIIDALDEQNRAADAAMGLVNDDLRGRYQFWMWMANASPRHFRWDYHPTVSYGVWTPEGAAA